jgi:uncharacterized membrane protein
MTTILNYLAERISIIPFLVGIIFIVTALILLRFPPKKINYFYGYRTPASMKSQEAWDFSQKYSATKMLQLGFFLVAISFINLLFVMSEEISLFIGIGLLILACIYMIVTTEKAIKKNFPNK